MIEWSPEKSLESKHDIKKTSFKKSAAEVFCNSAEYGFPWGSSHTWTATIFTSFRVVPVKILSDGISQVQGHFKWQKAKMNFDYFFLFHKITPIKSYLNYVQHCIYFVFSCAWPRRLCICNWIFSSSNLAIYYPYHCHHQHWKAFQYLCAQCIKYLVTPVLNHALYQVHRNAVWSGQQ